MRGCWGGCFPRASCDLGRNPGANRAIGGTVTIAAVFQFGAISCHPQSDRYREQLLVNLVDPSRSLIRLIYNVLALTSTMTQIDITAISALI